LDSRNGLFAEHNFRPDRAFDASTVDYLVEQQRTRLSSCLKVRDVLWPFLPWIGCLLVYLVKNHIAGLSIVNTVFYGICAMGGYCVLQTLRMLPSFLDIEHPILQTVPLLLNVTMFCIWSLPWISWPWVVYVFWCSGVVIFSVEFIRLLVSRFRGTGDIMGGVANIEHTGKMVLLRLHATMHERLVNCVFKAAKHARRGDGHTLVADLLKALSLFSDEYGICGDMVLSCIIPKTLRARIKKLLGDDHLRELVLAAESSSDQAIIAAWHARSDAIVKATLNGSYQSWDVMLDNIAKVVEEIRDIQL